jgi:hypothetical protein
VCNGDWKVRKSAIALYLNVIKEVVTKVPINPIIRNETHYFRHACPPTRDSNNDRNIYVIVSNRLTETFQQQEIYTINPLDEPT